MSASSSSIALPRIQIQWERKAFIDGQSLATRLLLGLDAAASSAGASSAPRRGIALAFALDTSGSMSQASGPQDTQLGGALPVFHAAGALSKLASCKRALIESIELLGESDQASLTIFSSTGVTVFAMAPMSESNKKTLLAKIDRLEASGGTALFDGWSLAALEAAKGLDAGLESRVVLLTDGEASTGLADADSLSAKTKALFETGISTSCFGVGAQFSEDLLCAMSDAGGGNFRYIPDAAMAFAAAADETQGLSSQIGRKAQLRLILEEGSGSARLLNDLRPNGDLCWHLPSLVAGRSIEALFDVEPLARASSMSVRFELSWEDRDGARRQVQQVTTLSRAADEADAGASDPEVAGAKAALIAAAEKARMARQISAGDWAGAQASLAAATATLMAAPQAYSQMGSEMADLNSLQASFASNDASGLRKSAVWQSYTRSKNQGARAHESADPSTPSDAS